MTGLDHDFNVRRVERYLAAVWESGASPVVLLNKVDLCEDAARKVDELRAVAIGVDVHAVSALTADGVDALAVYWRTGVTVGFVGSSGVGKSTLLNRLLGGDVQATAGVRTHDSRGRHTTTHRELFVLPQGGLVIDTPGMREFTLSDAENGLDAVFREIDSLAAHCRFGDCAHRGEPGCAVRGAVERGDISADRLASYEKLLKELRYEESKGDQDAAAERKRQGRIGAKAIRRMKRDD
jgi:ribosome biogenesis GTPase